VPPDAQLSCYSSVATTFYPTLVDGEYLVHILTLIARTGGFKIERAFLPRQNQFRFKFYSTMDRKFMQAIIYIHVSHIKIKTIDAIKFM
jgi:hypothetical protein